MSAINRLVRSVRSLAGLAALIALGVLFAPSAAMAAETCGIGDFVWHDLNKNGIQDANEPGINGVRLNVTTPNGTVAVTTRNSLINGLPGWYFVARGCGTYTVTVVPPSGFELATPNQGGNDQKDSNDNPTVAVSSNNTSNLSVDFGLVAVCTGRIGDFVWGDLNENGIQDPGELGVSNVAMTLTGTDEFGRPVSQSTTTETRSGRRRVRRRTGTTSSRVSAAVRTRSS